MEEKEQVFRIHPTFFDIVAILLSVFMLISVLLAKDVKQKYDAKMENLKREYLTRVNMLKKDVKEESLQGPDTAEIALSAILAGEGRYEFVLESQKLGKKTFGSTHGVKDELSRIRPAKLSLRVDRSVPTGITQELLYDAQELGIMPYLCVEEKNEGR